MQARFWVFVNDSPARVKLSPGQTLEWSASWRHDEGWSAEGESWSLEGDSVLRESWSDGRDCDGRSSYGASLACRLDQLDAGPNCDGIAYPEWERVDSSQRDYAAEAAGY